MNTNTNYAELYLADLSKDQDMLQNNILDYPASSVARFLLLCQLKKNNDSRFNELAKQTGVYLHNPNWMEFQLSGLLIPNENGSEDNLIISPEKRAEDQTILSPDRAIVDETDPQIESNDHQDLPNPTFESESLLPVEEIRTQEELPPDQNIDDDRKEESFVSNENVIEGNAENLNAEEQPQPVNDQIIENPVSENKDHNDQNIEEDKKEESFASNENVIEGNVEKQNAEELPQPVNGQINENPISENKDHDDQNIEEDTKEQTIDSLENEEEDNGDSFPFEPLHTVDYFASQGIKLSEDALNNDQLGKQVKSFTAWLKSMKRLHPGQLPEQNEVIEKIIQTSSEASNQNANVLTEAMADVLVKQGKREKAIEMFQKLSLINPSKSAYFAAKIENLKII